MRAAPHITRQHSLLLTLPAHSHLPPRCWHPCSVLRARRTHQQARATCGSGMSTQGRQQQVVLVTGCNQGGIGFNLCKQLAARGYQVVATAPDTTDMGELAALGCTLDTLDVTSSSSVDKAVAAVLAAHGRLDILVNNAGIVISGPVTETPEAATSRIFDINYHGCVRLVGAAAPAMMAAGRGLIVNMGSASAYSGLPFCAHYSASKAALRNLSDVLRNELRPFGVHVLYVAPGFIRTNIHANAARSAAIYCNPQGPYALAAEHMHRDPFQHIAKKALPVEEFAAQLAAVVASPRPPAYWRAGHLAWFAPLTAWLLPVWANDWLARQLFEMDELAAAAGAWRQRLEQQQEEQQEQKGEAGK